MGDVLIYWRDYRKNAEGPVSAWHSNAKLLGELQPGDRLWFVTSGKNLRQEGDAAGFLVAVWQVQEVQPNPGDNPDYPKDEYRYRIVASGEESVNFDATENLIIEGDNLETLKLLQGGYHGRVKMIYIDPPYNTGGEFIYPDNYKEGLAEYLKFSGQVSGEGVKLTTNAETDGRYHSKWLTMMYPRLFLARNLLREDGVIFVAVIFAIYSGVT